MSVDPTPWWAIDGWHGLDLDDAWTAGDELEPDQAEVRDLEQLRVTERRRGAR